MDGAVAARGNFCIDAARDALATCGRLEMIDTDLGSQFTSEAFISMLRDHYIQISMDRKYRWGDPAFVERLWSNLKYEEVYLKVYDSTALACASIGEHRRFSNTERRCQSLDRRTPYTMSLQSAD